MDHRGVTALYQDIGDCCRQALAFGNGAQMALAFFRRDFDQVVVGELRRLRQHGSGDRYFIVMCKGADDAGGGVVDGCEPDAELGERFGFDLPHEVGEHVVKQADLLLIESRSVTQK